MKELFCISMSTFLQPSGMDGKECVTDRWRPESGEACGIHGLWQMKYVPRLVASVKVDSLFTC